MSINMDPSKVLYDVNFFKDADHEDFPWLSSIIVTAYLNESHNASHNASPDVKDGHKIKAYGEKEGITYDKTGDEELHECNKNENEDVLRERPSQWEQAVPRRIKIGLCVARIIDRVKARENFLENHRHLSQDKSDLGGDLFNRKMRLRRAYIKGPKKGSGLWSRELHDGNFLLVESVHVISAWRGHGVVQELLRRPWTAAVQVDSDVRFAFARPAPIDRTYVDACSGETRDQKQRSDYDGNETFFRSQGYRRVGSSEWFCLAKDKNHASHKVSSSEDSNLGDEIPRSMIKRRIEKLRSWLSTKARDFEVMRRTQRFVHGFLEKHEK